MSSTSPCNSIIFTVPVEYDGALLKAFLRTGCGVSSHLLSVLKLEQDGILLNSANVTVRATVHSGDIVTINMPQEEYSVVPQNGLLDIIYEDNGIIIFNKPAGLTVHPVREYVDNTLANFSAGYALSKGEKYAFRALNRLDKDTSGCVICAKNLFYAYALKNTVKKVYFAICEGKLSGDGVIDAPIALKEGSIIQREVNFEAGKRAITHYSAVSSANDHTLVRLELETGRTHQIRVHMAHIGYPLAGDDMYGGATDMIPRQALHCKEISFVHPLTGQNIHIDAPFPKDMERLIWTLKEF